MTDPWTTWRDQGACRGVDPNVFFPERGDSCVAAKKVCAGCPVRGECLDFALAHGEKFGIWGGKSERERSRLRAARRPGSARWSDEKCRQVRSMAAQGLSQAEIARELGVSPRTVFRYLQPAETAS